MRYDPSLSWYDIDPDVSNFYCILMQKTWSKKYLLRIKGGWPGISGIIITDTVINSWDQ